MPITHKDFRPTCRSYHVDVINSMTLFLFLRIMYVHNVVKYFWEHEILPRKHRLIGQKIDYNKMITAQYHSVNVYKF